MTTCKRCRKPIPNPEDEVQTKKWYPGGEYEDVVICSRCERFVEDESRRDAFDEAYERARSAGWAD